MSLVVSVCRSWCLAITMALVVLIAGAVSSLLKSLTSSRFGQFCFLVRGSFYCLYQPVLFSLFTRSTVFRLFFLTQFLPISLVSINQYSLFWSTSFPEISNSLNSLYLELLSRCLCAISQNLKIRTYLDSSQYPAGLGTRYLNRPPFTFF